ncbi:hypothetical protein HK098_005210 [Nowakowskiella sp. JEL0407]|nr:hypothetical protein HK098_005210 [Nowakowskiella sp. JEL0407]
MSSNWWDEFPKGKSIPESWDAEKVAELLNDPNEVGGKTYLLVDVRRTDYGGGYVVGSINTPAQAFYPNIDDFIAKYSHVSKVFFYCSSSRGRGPRCASWYQDKLNEMGITTSQGLVLEGGIKKWIERYRDVPALVYGYDGEWWKN